MGVLGTMQQPVELSVVVPLYNEGQAVELLVRRLAAVLDRLGLRAEMLFIDDGSRDDTLARLRALRAADRRIKAVSFSRNFGKEVAIAAGLRFARGQAVVLMDGDLQHPPEVIEGFVEKWREGYQVVYGQRRSRETDGRLRRWLSPLYYRSFAALTGIALPEGAGDFRLLDRRVVDVLNDFPERTRFTKGLYAWVGFKQAGVPYTVASRVSGRSGWSLARALAARRRRHRLLLEPAAQDLDLCRRGGLLGLDRLRRLLHPADDAARRRRPRLPVADRRHHVLLRRAADRARRHRRVHQPRVH